MAASEYHITQPQRPFARTNRQTIHQRAQLLRELGYAGSTIAEICCGDCQQQQRIYRDDLQVETYRGLDLSPTVVAFNQAHGVPCVLGDALSDADMGQFATFDVVFFGPPLSEQCDGHSRLSFHEVTPGYAAFAHLLLHQLQFSGLLVCICPKTTHMGEIQRLYHQIQTDRPDVGLALIHYSHATLTGADQETEMRLKYVELWFSSELADAWRVKESRD